MALYFPSVHPHSYRKSLDSANYTERDRKRGREIQSDGNGERGKEREKGKAGWREGRKKGKSIIEKGQVYGSQLLQTGDIKQGRNA